MRPIPLPAKAVNGLSWAMPVPPRDPKGHRTGYTTGACAAAAAKAAARCLLRDAVLQGIETALPNKCRVRFPLERCERTGRSATCSILKDAGDDPDCTHGAEIVAEVELRETPGIEIRGGPGVATVTKPGLGLEVGTAAINPVPSRNITEMVEEELSGSHYRGARVIIAVPGGEDMAKKTTNARLGLLGGISILGTTGIVKPYSTAAWRASVVQEISGSACWCSPPAASPSNTRWRSTPSYPRRPSSRWGISSASGCDTARGAGSTAPSWSG